MLRIDTEQGRACPTDHATRSTVISWIPNRENRVPENRSLEPSTSANRRSGVQGGSPRQRLSEAPSGSSVDLDPPDASHQPHTATDRVPRSQPGCSTSGAVPSSQMTVVLLGTSRTPAVFYFLLLLDYWCWFGTVMVLSLLLRDLPRCGQKTPAATMYVGCAGYLISLLYNSIQGRCGLFEGSDGVVRVINVSPAAEISSGAS